MKKILKSLPSMKAIIITIAVCLIIGGLTQGIHPRALIGLVLAGGILILLTVRNYDPDAWEAHNNPVQYSYRTERDKLFQSLRALTEAVEADSDIVAPDIVTVRADQAREVLDQVSGRNKSPAQ